MSNILQYRFCQGDKPYFGVNFVQVNLELYSPETQRWYGDYEAISLCSFLYADAWYVKWDGRYYHKMKSDEVRTFDHIAKLMRSEGIRVLYGN